MRKTIQTTTFVGADSPFADFFAKGGKLFFRISHLFLPRTNRIPWQDFLPGLSEQIFLLSY